jgi:hypothetical protein
MSNPGKLAMHFVFFLILALIIAGLYREIIASTDPQDRPTLTSQAITTLPAPTQPPADYPYPHPITSTSTFRYLLKGMVKEVNAHYWLVDNYLVRWPEGVVPPENTRRGNHLYLLVRPMPDGTYLVDEVLDQ